jgi:hypothetical protein
MDAAMDRKETLRIKGNTINFKGYVYNTIDEGFHIVYSPSLNVSGYGRTKEEAHETFKEGYESLFKELLDLPIEIRNAELRKLGFQLEKYQTKNFSKLFVDENGKLHGLEHLKLEVEPVEAFV